MPVPSTRGQRRRPRQSIARHLAHLRAATLLALVLVLLAIGSALAHANLVNSNPASGASLAKPPAQVQLWFSEPLEPSFSQAVIYDTNRQRVDAGDSRVAPNDPTSLIVGLKPNLPNGTYVVAWKTQSKVDGHVVYGTVPFGVGVASQASAAASLQPANGFSSGSPAEMIVRWLALVSSTALAGAFAFWLLQRAFLTQLTSREAIRRIRKGQFRIAGIALGLVWVSNLGLLTIQLLVTGGAPTQVLLGTQYGELTLTRLVLCVLLTGVLGLRALPRKNLARIDQLGLAVGAALLATISLTSHSAAGGNLTPVGVLPVGLGVDWLHLVAVAIWFGGLLQLAVVAPVVLRAGEPEIRARVLGGLIPRFSLVAGASLAALGVTGLGEALLHVGTLDNLIDTGYGQALLVKIVFITPLLALAAINHFFVRPALARAGQARGGAVLARGLGVAELLRWTVRLEVLFVVAVIAAVGVMTSLSPPRQLAASSGVGPLTETAPAADLSTTLTVSPGRPGPNQYVVLVHDASGQPTADATAVFARLTYLDSDLGVAQVALNPAGNGRFICNGTELAVNGKWQTEVIVRRPGKDDARATYVFAVTPNGAQTTQPPTLQLSGLFFVGLLVAAFGLYALRRGARLRGDDLRRAAAIAACGVGLLGVGGGLSVQEFQSARAATASAALAQLHPATPQSIADGQQVYAQNCLACHGPGARGDGPLAATINPRPSDLVVHVPQHTDAELEAWIADGFPGSAMPAWKDKLTEQQRWDVLNYLKTLASRAETSP
ncbi:MAG TPA: copper resistance protein CopC [Chloroflexota bacterium]|nr:copper resistance protein CopC [Chloroflexota bacterium]